MGESTTKLVPCGCGCGQLIPLFDRRGRKRRFVRGHSSRVTKPKVERVCRRCGEVFVMKKIGQWYCSDSCHYPNVVCACGCGKKLSKKSRLQKAKYIQGHQWLGKKHTKEQIEKISKATKGENNPNWQGGIATSKYTTEFLKRLRKGIKKDFSNICAFCGRHCKGKSGHVHHIDYDKMNNDKSNLILLCKYCHGLTIPEKDRDHWQTVLNDLRRRKGNGVVRPLEV